MNIFSISKEFFIPIHKTNDLPEIAGKVGSGGEPDTSNFQRLFDQIVSAANHEQIQDIISPVAVKLIQNLMDLELLDMMNEEIEDKPSSISIREPQTVINDPGLLEASKTQHTINENDILSSKNSFDTVIEKAAEIHDIDPDLIKSVIQVESNFKPESTSSAGAMGLMQLMPGTAQELGVKNAYDPVENIMGGTKYLKGLLNRYSGNISLALAAYNWGVGNIGRNPNKMPQETKNYIIRVTQLYRESKV
ncbi:MAG: lytic transglycosylase domain-containing protein [Pseudomonadota bacterium]